MKKILSYLLICLFVLVLASCSLHKDTEKHTVHVDENEDGICDVCEENLVIATPTVVIDEEGLATWKAIKNAASYVYKLNGSEMATMKTSLQLNDGDVLQVKAIAEAPFADSEYSAEQTYVKAPELEYGIPKPQEGFYMRDADVLQEGNKRYLVYTTNATKANEDNVIAVRVGELTENGWLYGEQQVILSAGEEGKWDQYLGSASLVKGVFAYQGENYQYLLAYQGTSYATNTVNQIGLAVGNSLDEEFVKLPDPIVTFNGELFGTNMVGCYAPSLVNYDKASGIRMFYTLADAFGHFPYFADFNAANLDEIKLAKAMITNEGDLHSGEDVTMFPNADFAYDAANGLFYAVKDYSPSPANKPNFADEIELAFIVEEELYTTDLGEGWQSVMTRDFTEVDSERIYSGCIVSDEYGHVLEAMELVYNVCESGDEYLYTQQFKSFVVE